MKARLPARSDHGARVIKFTPRRLSTAPSPRSGGGDKPSDASPGRSPATPAHLAGDGDEFRHRMLTNLAALVFTAALTAAGIWLAISIAELRRTQDCVLAGHRNCAPIVPSRGGPA
ncbi:MAG: hypothetical protein M9932_00280 [Xanthobacteraceae bacterium]|nr:hypothetical protein [Xanthobacteraceae bacterium]